MVRTTFVRFRASQKELEQIRNAAYARRFSTVSEFLRTLASDRELWLETKIQEINITVQQIKELVKSKK